MLKPKFLLFDLLGSVLWKNSHTTLLHNPPNISPKSSVWLCRVNSYVYFRQWKASKYDRLRSQFLRVWSYELLEEKSNQIWNRKISLDNLFLKGDCADAVYDCDKVCSRNWWCFTLIPPSCKQVPMVQLQWLMAARGSHHFLVQGISFLCLRSAADEVDLRWRGSPCFSPSLSSTLGRVRQMTNTEVQKAWPLGSKGHNSGRLVMLQRAPWGQA